MFSPGTNFLLMVRSLRRRKKPLHQSILSYDYVQYPCRYLSIYLSIFSAEMQSSSLLAVCLHAHNTGAVPASDDGDRCTVQRALLWWGTSVCRGAVGKALNTARTDHPAVGGKAPPAGSEMQTQIIGIGSSARARAAPTWRARGHGQRPPPWRGACTKTGRPTQSRAARR